MKKNVTKYNFYLQNPKISTNFAASQQNSKHIMNEKTKFILKVVISVLIAALTALATGLGLTSCNVTRVITNESQYLQKGDTSVVIQTKTVETYDAKKQNQINL